MQNLIRYAKWLATFFISYRESHAVCKLISRHRHLPFFTNKDASKIRASASGKVAVIIGGGSSVTKAKLDGRLDGYKDDFVICLNASVFAGIKYDIGLVETSRSRYMRSFLIRAFQDRMHLAGAKKDSKILFTQISMDIIDDHLSKNYCENCCTLPQGFIDLPPRLSDSSTRRLVCILRLHLLLVRLGVAPVGLFARCSLIRAAMLAITLGFKEIHLLGIDGDYSYYFQDSIAWPELSLLKEWTDAAYLGSTHNLMFSGRFVSRKYPESPKEAVHSTWDSTRSVYTIPVLIDILSKAFEVQIVRLYKDASILP